MVVLAVCLFGELEARSFSGGGKKKKTSAILLMAFYSRCVYSYHTFRLSYVLYEMKGNALGLTLWILTYDTGTILHSTTVREPNFQIFRFTCSSRN